MRACLIAIAALAGLAAGCGHAEQIRQAQDYERFLKNSLGTVATDAPVQASAHAASEPALD